MAFTKTSWWPVGGLMCTPSTNWNGTRVDTKRKSPKEYRGHVGRLWFIRLAPEEVRKGVGKIG